MTFDGWSVIDFPPPAGSLSQAPQACVYVFCWKTDKGPVPFYVGESGRLAKRICDDYRTKYFTAPTDFCVGEAAAHLISKGHQLVVFYRASSDRRPDRRKEERALIRSLQLEGRRLLNCFPRYCYQASVGREQEERTAVLEFMNALVP